MRIMLWLPLGLGACGGNDQDLLASLDGGWAGSFVTDVGTFPVTAGFAWDDAGELLTGEVTVEETPAAPHAYAVRRWETTGDTLYLELTDAVDGTRGLDMSGGVATAFSGETTLRYPCEADTCGWTGTFDLQPSAAPLDTGPVPTPPPTGGTGAR